MMETIGYRYSVDRNGEIFIIKLQAKDEQPGHNYTGDPIDWRSNECICLSITNANTGEEVEQATLRGIRKNYVEYRKNEKIPGMCWFMHDPGQLSWLHQDHRTGETYESFFLYRKLDYMMTECYKVQPEAVAAELHISTQELWQRIELLKAGIKEEEKWGYPILRAMQKLSEK